jgi:hypothetical protein
LANVAIQNPLRSKASMTLAASLWVQRLSPIWYLQDIGTSIVGAFFRACAGRCGWGQGGVHVALRWMAGGHKASAATRKRFRANLAELFALAN